MTTDVVVQLLKHIHWVGGSITKSLQIFILCSSIIVETSYLQTLKVSFQIAKKKSAMLLQQSFNNTTSWSGFGKSCIAQQLHHGRSLNLRECHDMLKQRRGRSMDLLICCPESQEAQGSKRLKCNNLCSPVKTHWHDWIMWNISCAWSSFSGLAPRGSLTIWGNSNPIRSASRDPRSGELSSLDRPIPKRSGNGCAALHTSSLGICAVKGSQGFDIGLASARRS